VEASMPTMAPAKGTTESFFGIGVSSYVVLIIGDLGAQKERLNQVSIILDKQ
jgi:hypothetical protein